MDTKSSYTEKLEVTVAKKKEELTAYEPYKPDEMFRFKGENIFSVEDFWQYAYSQLDGMAETIAEFLVARALGIKKAENVNYWTAYDMSYHNKRIEVKATSYVHPWNKEISKIRTFSIAPTNNSYWESQDAEQKLSRQSEVYVFCLNTNKDIGKRNALAVDDWVFYVVPTFVVDGYCKETPAQKKISLNVVKRLAKEEVSYDRLREAVDEAIVCSDSYYIGK